MFSCMKWHNKDLRTIGRRLKLAQLRNLIASRASPKYSIYPVMLWLKRFVTRLTQYTVIFLVETLALKENFNHPISA